MSQIQNSELISYIQRRIIFTFNASRVVVKHIVTFGTFQFTHKSEIEDYPCNIHKETESVFLNLIVKGNHFPRNLFMLKTRFH